MRRVIVTGAHGFLGRHLVHDLERGGVSVTGLTRQAPPGTACIAMGDAPWSPSRLTQIIEQVEPDVIFHLVGRVVGSSAQLQELNVGVTEALMQALRETQMRPLLVCCGSAAEYGSAARAGVPLSETTKCTPISSYGAAKLAQTEACLAFAAETGTPVLIARIFNPIGAGMPSYLALGNFAQQIVAEHGPHGVLQTGNIDVLRDFIDVRQVARALVSLACNPEAQGVVNVCSGQATALRTLIDMMIKASGKEIAIQRIPGRMRASEIPVVVGSTARLTKFGVAPPSTNLRAAVARVWQHAALLHAGAA